MLGKCKSNFKLRVSKLITELIRQVLSSFAGSMAQAKLTAIQTIATSEVTALQNAVAAKQAFFTSLFGGLGK